MEISIRVIEHGLEGPRAHYCVARDAAVTLDVEGVRRGVTLFCPLCGAITASDAPDVRPRELAGAPESDGTRCPHGFPDTMGSYEHVYRWNIAECRAAALAPPGSILERWARPCPHCRSEFLERHYGAVELALWELMQRLSQASREAAGQVHAIQADLNVVCALLRAVRSRPLNNAAVETACEGYVYAITDEHAVKIGWSATHPGLPGGRLAQLQTASPRALRLLGAIRASMDRERELQRRFAEHRLRGEWFRFVPAIVEYFDSQ